MAKTIFNSSEKSNFILNMTEEQYSSIASKTLAAAFMLVPFFTIPAELSGETGYSIASAGFAVGGVACLILALIAIVKKFVIRKMLIPVCAFAAMLGWGVISLINSYDTGISFYGMQGRGEGLLAIVFYFGFFLTGLTLRTKKSVSVLIGSLIGVGILNSLWALAQLLIPPIHNPYKYISASIEANAVSGLSHSPIFLAMVLSLSLTAALISSVMTDSKKKRIVCIVSSCVFAFLMMLTYSLVGICGIAIALISSAVVLFRTKAPKINFISLGGVIASAALSVVLVCVGAVGDLDGYRLYDGNIMWWDSYFRISTSGLYKNDKVEIGNTADVYYFLNTETLDIIGEAPLTGTGPDQLVYPQIYKTGEITENIGTFDRNYNEYLYTAATRGIPSLIALLAVIASLIYAAEKKLKKEKSENNTVLFCVLIGGAVLFLIGNSSIAFSPVFWAAAGAACADISDNPPKKSGKK